MRISIQTQNEVDVYEQEVTLPSGITFNHRETLKMINAHKRGKYYNNTDDDIFWSLGIPRALDFSAKLDLDTRHFKVEGYGDFNSYQAWACNMRLQNWFKDTGFANDLDDIGDSCTDFGSAVVKLTETKGGRYDVNECDLLKLWFDPTIKEFYGETKIELHEMEEHEVMSKKGWAHKDKAWEKAIVVDYIETEKSDMANQVSEKRKFWERVGYYDVSFYENDDPVNGKYLMEKAIQKVDGKDVETWVDLRDKREGRWKFMHTIHAGEGDGEVVVFSEEIKPEDDLYIDFHISKYEDRWLRIGVYERLFGIQKLANEVVNYDKDNQRIASLLLLRTKNKRLVGSNILQEAKSGLITDADLEQIGLNNTFVNEFVTKLSTYEQKADSLCKTPDLKDFGDQRTFRGLAAMVNRANSAFKKSRDRISEKVAEMLVDRILPIEVKDWNKEKSLEIAGFEIDIRMYDALAHLTKMNEWLKGEFKKGRNPNMEEKKAFAEKLQATIDREGRKLKLPENYYDFDFGLGMNPTGESENKEQKNDAYFNVISWVLSNPAVTTIPGFRDYCEINGITPFHLSAEQTQQVMAGQGGKSPEPVGQAKKDRLSAAIDTTE